MSNKRIDLELITSLVDKETRVLDIGCGNGELLDSLKMKKVACQVNHYFQNPPGYWRIYQHV